MKKPNGIKDNYADSATFLHQAHPNLQQRMGETTLIGLFWAFFCISPVTFGGGYAIIPLMEREIVEKRGWLSSKDMAEVFAVAGAVPGAMALNSAAYIGYKTKGVKGSLASLLGMLLPAFCLVILLSIIYMQVKDQPKVEAAFLSIRATIVALIVYAAYKIGKTAILDWITLTIATASFLLLLFFGSALHPAFVIVSGGLAGIGIVAWRAKRGIETKLTKPDKSLQKQDMMDIDYMI